MDGREYDENLIANGLSDLGRWLVARTTEHREIENRIFPFFLFLRI